MTVGPNTAGVFEDGCTERIDVGCTRERAYEALQRVERWPRYLPHVAQIDVLYDDGQYQEFLMDVDSDAGPLRVRSVRNCRAEDVEIEFFQPQPPAFLRHHAGGWEFHEASPGTCTVVAHHWWNLNRDVAAAKFAPTPEESSAQQVKALLRNHARLALRTWKGVLEQTSGDAT